MTKTVSHTRKQRVLDEVKRARRRRTLYATAVLAAVMIAIIVGVIVSSMSQQQHPQQTGIIGTPIPQTLYNNIAGVNAATLAQIGTGQATAASSISSSYTLTQNGKPEVLYIGAEYCPYCAAERWSIIVALSKFGTFTGLTYMLSADVPEIYPDTATFSFVGSTYTSSYISFVSVETQNRSHGSLQTPTSNEQNIMNAYDSSGSIPFVDVANRYSYTGSQYSPSVLGNLNWTQIGSQLDDSNSIVARNVDGAANTLITAICKVDGGLPNNICSQSFANLFMPITSANNMPLLIGTNCIIGNRLDCKKPVLYFY